MRGTVQDLGVLSQEWELGAFPRLEFMEGEEVKEEEEAEADECGSDASDSEQDEAMDDEDACPPEVKLGLSAAQAV